MSWFALSRRVLGTGVAALLIRCGGSQTRPIGAPGAMPQSRRSRIKLDTVQKRAFSAHTTFGV